MDTTNAIPGGRYGCAQFIKICGSPELQSLSLGRIAQMIQQLVSDDIMRYHKTLLIWTKKFSTRQSILDESLQASKGDDKISDYRRKRNDSFDSRKSPADLDRERKLDVVQKAVEQVLAEHP